MKRRSVKPMTDPEVCNVGLREGWLLSYSDGTGTVNVEKDDDNSRFKSDAEALDWVRERALGGSVPHLFAMAFHENWEEHS